MVDNNDDGLETVLLYLRYTYLCIKYLQEEAQELWCSGLVASAKRVEQPSEQEWT